MSKKSAFIFTNYNNSDLTKNLVISLLKSITENNLVDIVIVDNNSTSNEVIKLKKLKKKYSLKVYFLQENIGYFRGLNYGLNSINCKEYDFVVIGNNDLIFENFIDSVYKSKFVNKYAVISPDIITLDGFHQNPHVLKPPSKFRELIYDIYFKSFFLSRIILFISKLTKSWTRRGDEDNYEIPQILIQGYGACYILTPLFFKNFHKLWSPTFLMYEEFFLSLQLERKNLKIFYDPSIKVIHMDHATVSKLPSKKMWEITKVSHKEYRKYVKIW
tara:strand:- start:9454 stop:10272 length:819 start_codon:yes stop_codon:yes gene_type:complete